MENSKFNNFLQSIEEMTSASVLTQPVDSQYLKPPVNGKYGNSVDPTNNDFYAPGDSRIPKGPKKKRKKKKDVKKKKSSK